MKAIETLRDEHEGVLAVLTQLERASIAVERDAAIPRDVFDDVGEFFSIFVDRCHHGKEESEVFPRLTTPDGSAVADRLENEHVTGRRLAGAYQEAVRAYQPGDVRAGARLAASARAYSAFLRDHIDLETRELFPVMEALTGDDDTLVEAFERVEEERIGPGTHERLHAMIDGLAGRIDPWVRARAVSA